MPTEAKRAIGTHADVPGRSVRTGPTSPHRIWHFGSFGATALLVSLATERGKRRLFYCAGVFVFGLAIELSQSRVTGVPVEWYDVRDDGIGILVFTLVGESRRVRQTLLRDAAPGEI